MTKKILLLFLAFALHFNLSAEERIRILYGPYLQMVGTHEASVVWVTNKKAQSWVEIAPDDKNNFYAEARPQFYETLFGRKVSGTVHKVKITGLEKGTTYRYRVFSKEILDEQPYSITYGSVAATSVYGREPLAFTTLNPDKPDMNFIMVNDIHADNELLKSLLKDVKKGKTDFVLFNGDMVSHMDSEKNLFEGFMNTSVKIFASEIPFYYARGNHESRGGYASRYMDYFPTNSGKPYYCFRQGPVFFIVIDGGEDKPDNDIEYLGTAAFDLYRQEQAAWLQEITQSEAFRSAPFKIAVIHVPPIRSTWHGPLHTKELFVPILNKAGINLMLCGHLHERHYVEAGKEGCDFPVLINSNDEVVQVSTNEKDMTVEIKDTTGKTISKYSYPAVGK